MHQDIYNMDRLTKIHYTIHLLYLFINLKLVDKQTPQILLSDFLDAYYYGGTTD